MTGCKWFSSAGTTYYAWTNFKVPEGTPVFQQGFKDGCSTVLYARGNDFYHTRYKYKYDPTLIGNTEYRFGHQRGYTWCFQTVLSAVSGPNGAPDKFLFVYGNESWGFDASPGDINNSGLFGGQGGDSAFNSSLTTPGSGVNAMFDVFQKGTDSTGVGGVGGTVFGTNPLWSGGSSGQFLGWY